MKTMHLFAGAGGGLLGDLILGHTPIVAVEWDKYACSILREMVSDGWFSDLSVYEGDVRLFYPSEYKGRVDCIHAGFPCQDISVAGKQAGVGEETRSGLYREVLRIADTVRPEYIFLENVSAILSNGLGTVLGDLSASGYLARWICVRASDVGANHGRDRWWLLARRTDVSPHAEHGGSGRREQQQEGVGEAASELGHPEHDGQPSKPQLRSDESAGNEWRQEEPQQTGQPSGADRPADVSGIRRGEDGSESGEPAGEVAYADTARLQRFNGSQAATGSSTAQRFTGQRGGNESGQIKPSMGLLATKFTTNLVPGWWEVEPDIGRVTNVSKDRAAQLKCLGNGQVPLQAAVAFSILMELF